MIFSRDAGRSSWYDYLKTKEQDVQGRSGMRGRLDQPACLDPGFSNGNDPSSRSGQAAGEDRHTRAGERSHDSVSELILRVEQIDRAEKHGAAALARGALSDGCP